MQAVSADYLAAWRGDGQRIRRVLVDFGDGAGFVEVPFSSFKVDAARGENVVARYSAQVTLPPDAPALDTDGDRFQCQAGFLINGSPQWTTLATLTVEDVDWGSDGSQIASGFSAERYVDVAGFEIPTLVTDATGIAAMRYLLSVVQGDVRVTGVADRPVPGSVFDSSQGRWQAIRYYAEALSADVYADPVSGFVVKAAPLLSDPSMLTIDYGGVMVSARRKQSRTGVPSVVVVEGNRTNTDTPPPRGVAKDTNAFSKRYVFGRFGVQQKTVNSPIMLTNDQCAKAAQTILAQYQGLAKSLTLTAVPADFLEPGDVITVQFADGTSELHIIDSLSHSSDDGPQSFSTRTTAGA